ncbi:MAG: acetyl-CoA carboxylase biotin carboxyl carrier protein [Acidobacteria bacterium]|nr:acetyl-CoA carboxylase biotin carboxyl carrier protein [Acidobacteriota bacterium]
MNFKEILELIDKVASSGIAAVEVETAGTKVRVEGKSAGPQVIHAYGEAPRAEMPTLAAAPPQAATAPAAAPGAPAAAPAIDPNLHILTSPIVGTFYRSPNPEAQSFVNVGDRVSKGQVLCIIEAMKLMNEIESDVDGVVKAIFPQNGQPVEYGENLFGIATS